MSDELVFSGEVRYLFFAVEEGDGRMFLRILRLWGVFTRDVRAFDLVGPYATLAPFVGCC